MTVTEVGLLLLLASMLFWSAATWRRLHSWIAVSIVVALHISLAWFAGFLI